MYSIDELVTHPVFTDYQLRVRDPELCDPSVKQHSGYLDITDGKHLFFWYVPIQFAQRLITHMSYAFDKVLRVAQLSRKRTSHFVAQWRPGLQLHYRSSV